MQTVISVKIDKTLKEEAKRVEESAGLTLSTLVNAYLRQVVATRRIELYAPEPMDKNLTKLISEVEKEIKTGKVSPGYKSAREFISALKK